MSNCDIKNQYHEIYYNLILKQSLDSKVGSRKISVTEIPN